MRKKLEPITSKDSKPRGKNGGRRALPPEQKKMQLIFYFPAWLLEAFKALVPQQRDRNNLAIDWVRAYVVACGESDRLFAQSPILLKAIHWIESQPEPDEALLGELQSLLVERASDEVKIEDGVTKTKGGAYIV